MLTSFVLTASLSGLGSFGQVGSFAQAHSPPPPHWFVLVPCHPLRSGRDKLSGRRRRGKGMSFSPLSLPNLINISLKHSLACSLVYVWLRVMVGMVGGGGRLRVVPLINFDCKWSKIPFPAVLPIESDLSGKPFSFRKNFKLDQPNDVSWEFFS